MDRNRLLLTASAIGLLSLASAAALAQVYGPPTQKAVTAPIQNDGATTVSPLVVRPLVPAPKVGDGAPYFSPDELADTHNVAVREERVKMSKLRQTIARRLKDAQATAAMLTTFNDVDMSAVMGLRSGHGEFRNSADQCTNWKFVLRRCRARTPPRPRADKSAQPQSGNKLPQSKALRARLSSSGAIFESCHNRPIR